MRNGPYVLVVPPSDYPGKRYRGRYAYEHHVVWWQHTGELIQSGEVLHHMNENRHDNRFSNLEKLTIASHGRYHNQGSGSPPAVLVCGLCGIPFERELRHVRSKLKQGQTNFYCSRSHQVRAQHLARRDPGDLLREDVA